MKKIKHNKMKIKLLKTELELEKLKSKISKLEIINQWLIDEIVDRRIRIELGISEISYQ